MVCFHASAFRSNESCIRIGNLWTERIFLVIRRLRGVLDKAKTFPSVLGCPLSFLKRSPKEEDYGNTQMAAGDEENSGYDKCLKARCSHLLSLAITCSKELIRPSFSSMNFRPAS
jgi:hypothetical protein